MAVEYPKPGQVTRLGPEDGAFRQLTARPERLSPHVVHKVAAPAQTSDQHLTQPPHVDVLFRYQKEQIRNSHKQSSADILVADSGTIRVIFRQDEHVSGRQPKVMRIDGKNQIDVSNLSRNIAKDPAVVLHLRPTQLSEAQRNLFSSQFPTSGFRLGLPLSISKLLSITETSGVYDVYVENQVGAIRQIVREGAEPENVGGRVRFKLEVKSNKVVVLSPRDSSTSLTQDAQDALNLALLITNLVISARSIPRPRIPETVG